jgi:hypothetical protein
MSLPSADEQLIRSRAIVDVDDHQLIPFQSDQSSQSYRWTSPRHLDQQQSCASQKPTSVSIRNGHEICLAHGSPDRCEGSWQREKDRPRCGFNRILSLVLFTCIPDAMHANNNPDRGDIAKIPPCLIFSGRINGDVFRLQSRSARIQVPNLVVQVHVNTNRI